MPPPSAARRLWRSSISKRQPLEAPSGVSNEPIGRVGGSLIGCLGPCIVEVAETGPSIVQVARGLDPFTGKRDNEALSLPSVRKLCIEGAASLSP